MSAGAHVRALLRRVLLLAVIAAAALAAPTRVAAQQQAAAHHEGCRATEAAGACFDRGLRMAAASPGANGAMRLGSLFADACVRGAADACHIAGRLAATPAPTDSGVAAGLVDAARLFDLGCRPARHASADACAALAEAYARGIGIARRPDTARVLYARACDLGNATACFRWAIGEQQRMAGRDSARAPRSSPARLRRALERACDGGSLSGCSGLANTLQRALDTTAAGRATPPARRDAARALSLYRRACEGGRAGRTLYACGALGVAFASGTLGLPANRDSARAYYELACRGYAGPTPPADPVRVGDGGWCYNYAQVLRTSGARDSAQQIYRLGCLVASGDACAGLTYGAVRLGPANAVVSLRYATTACDRGVSDPESGWACSVAGQFLLSPPFTDSLTAAGYFGRACRLDYASGCAISGLLAGQLTRDPAAGSADLERACTLGEGRVCHLLAQSITDTSAVGRARVRAYERGACAAGEASGCTALAAFARTAGDTAGARQYRARACALQAARCGAS